MAAQRQREYKPRQDRSGIAPAEVECTGCGLTFISAARSHTNCPGCRRNLRVHRPPAGPRPAAVSRRTVSAKPVRQSLPPREPLPFRAPRLVPPTAPFLVPRLPLPPAEDDGETYIFERGRLVLARWDAAGLVSAAELPPSYLASELAARGWQLRAHGPGVCKVVRTWAAVADYPAAAEPCQRPAEHGELCRKCFEALRSPA